MGITYKEAKPWEQQTYITNVLDFVKGDKEFFLVLANLLCMYDTLDDNDRVKEQRQADLDDFLITKGLDESRTEEEIKKFKSLIEELYQEVPGNLSKSRGKILEAIVLTYGPKSIVSPIKLNSYNEPQIFDNGNLIGANNCVIDAVFHDDRGTARHVAEYIECKASIQSFIDLRFFPRLSGDRKKKWKYIKSVYSYISSKYFTPNIYIACYTNDIFDYQQKLNQHRLGYVTILGDEDIFSMIS